MHDIAIQISVIKLFKFKSLIILYLGNALLQATASAVQHYGAHLGPPLIIATPFVVISPHELTLGQWFNPTCIGVKVLDPATFKGVVVCEALIW